ncbi:alpha/beta hydrolase family protein [Rossellomorea vietnamensis]|uniref:alpha/beta hydrolase family protein n=1 Tax=Rossellomorea vietnamensis TaxID=218284 RepID=UPI00054EF31E|nr:alpha/beta fold hydrolase [Rossellomorea vietnamensis]
MRKHTINPYNYYSIQPNKQNESAKVIIIYHGWGGSALGYRDLAEELAGEGFNVVVPEIIYHDTRQKLADHFESKTVQDYFWETIMTTIDEFHDFVKALGIDKENVILIGSSMGGCIANGIFAREPMVGGLVNMNGSGSFVLTELLFREKDGRGDIPDQLKKRLMDYDPVDSEPGLSPVLLMHGDCDEIMPIEGQMDYDRYLKGNRRHVDFRVYEGVNHQITSDMIGDLIRWLNGLSK